MQCVDVYGLCAFVLPSQVHSQGDRCYIIVQEVELLCLLGLFTVIILMDGLELFCGFKLPGRAYLYLYKYALRYEQLSNNLL